MTEQNRPRHSQGPEQDPYDNSGYDDSYDEAYDYPAAGAGAGAAGAGAAGAAGDPPEKSGPPLRGLAMILTAVAVVLIIWGGFSLFGGDDDSDDTASGSDTSATATAPAPGEGDQGSSEAPGTDDAEGADGTSADPSASAEAPAPGDDADNGDSAAEVDRGIGVTVLNNSTEAGLSRSGADRVRDSDWRNVGFGNLQGRIDGISEESRVYYPEGNAAAQTAAEQVASDLGLTAVPGNTDYYDRFREASVREGGAADAVVVVLTGPLG